MSLTEKERLLVGYCHCGCGQRTNKQKKTDNKIGYKKGDYRKYVVGHGRKGKAYGHKDKIKTKKYTLI